MFSVQNHSTAAAVATVSIENMAENGAEPETAVNATLENLRNLFLHPSRPSPPTNKLTIVTRSEVERFRMTLEEPISFKYLQDYYRQRHHGMALNIYHANSNYDFLQQITSQTDLDEAIRLHKLRSRESKFRLYISPKQNVENIMRPDPRGIFQGASFEDAYSETGTSAFTTALAPARQRLHEVLSTATDAPQPPAEWREGNSLGTGAHGRVLQCYDRDTDEQLVVKKIYARGDVNSMRRRMMCLSEEVSILSKVSHENIVKYRGVCIADNCVNIFMEYMTGGSLYDLINKQFGALSPKSTIEYTRQILRGLEYLHSLEIVHRDIKSANILRHAAAPPVIKIGDFGSAQFYRALASLHSVDYNSTPHYTAPEVVKSNHPYDEKADIWSVAITMIEMLTTRTPYSNIEANAVLFKIAEGPIQYTLPNDCPRPLVNIIAAMLNPEPRRRPSAKELLKMDIFS